MQTLRRYLLAEHAGYAVSLTTTSKGACQWPPSEWVFRRVDTGVASLSSRWVGVTAPGVFRHFSDRRGVSRQLGGFRVGRAERRNSRSAAWLASVIVGIIVIHCCVCLKGAILWNERDAPCSLVSPSGASFRSNSFSWAFLGIKGGGKIRFIDRMCCKGRVVAN